MKLTLQRVVDDDILTIVHWKPLDFPSVYVGYDELTLGDRLYKYTWGVVPANYPVPAIAYQVEFNCDSHGPWIALRPKY